jgi:AAA15 family ATPase/GTPase
MKQKIIIKNFGPIKDVEMEIDDFTIFIGPQTSGKSTIAKSVFFFMSLRDDMQIYLQRAFDDNKIEDEVNGFSKVIFRKIIEYWGGYNSDDDGFELRYWYSDDIWIEIQSEKHGYKYGHTILFSPVFIDYTQGAIKYLKKRASNFHEKSNKFSTSNDLAQKDFERDRALIKLNKSLNEIFGFDNDLLFIPAGRSILSTLSEQIQNIAPKSLDSLMRTFIERINASKGFSGSDHIEPYNLFGHLEMETGMIQLLKKLSESILNGSYFNDDEEGDKIKFNNENYIKLLFSSSGQQETVWIIQMVLLLILNKQKVFIVIEEPEAHLFPKTQKDILNLIVLLSNTSDNKIFITTHSPYILTSLNNNIYAYQVGQQHEEKVDKIINKKLWMNPEKVQAYFVGGEGNKGKIRSIIDPDLKIIQSEEIDSASSINNNEFDQLFDLE